MPRTKPDRRIKRTQQSLHVALNSLIMEKGYEEVTIKDLTHRANVGRSTFYAHHGSKEGLLLSGLQHFRAALIAAQRESLMVGREAPKPVLGFSRVFFEHMDEYRDIYRTLIGSESGPAVERGIKRIVAEVVRNELGATKGNGRENKIPRSAVIEFTVEALFSILHWRFEHNPKLPPAEADAIFRQLVLPALSAVGVG